MTYFKAWQIPILIALVAATVWLAVRSVRAVSNYDHAAGVVERVDTTRDGDGDTQYAPIVAYSVGGVRLRVTGDPAIPAMYRVGEHVDVLYDPADPQSAAIDVWMERWTLTLFAGVAALAGTLCWLRPIPFRIRRVAGRSIFAAGIAALLVQYLLPSPIGRTVAVIGMALMIGGMFSFLTKPE